MPQVGRYHIHRKIADGGMAEIFLGTQRGLEGFERPVVLKRILAALVADPQFRHMLIDEAHVAMSLTHSNIVQVLDLGHSRQRYYLVMELVDGWDLNQLLNRSSLAQFPLQSEISLYIIAEVCRALSYAHSRLRNGQPMNIVHRDISPQNILISEQGEVKLADFGIAKAMGRQDRTSQGVIKGKLAFMSPEQASGRPLDARSDLFSLGSLLYVLFTNQRPFQAPTDLETILRVQQCQYTAADEVAPDLDPAVVRIIHRAMQAFPANRYQSAEQMLVDIETVQRNVYRPAGQTELKRWLALLGEKDHVPTISRQEISAPSVKVTQELDVLEDADVVFEESAVHEATIAEESLLPTIEVPTLPPPIPQASKSPPTIIKNHRPNHGRLAVVLSGLGVLILGILGFLYLRGEKSPISSPPRTVESARYDSPKKYHDASVKAVAPALPIPIVLAPSPDAQPLAQAALPTPKESSSPRDAGPETVTASAEDDEEETLLKTAEPDDSERVLGAEEGLPPARAKRPEVAPKPMKASPPEPVSVHIVSVPEGAVIKLGKRVFGRAPMNLRFRPGITYNLTFVKKGYVTKNSLLDVLPRKNQTHKVSLKKAPAKKKSFFRRIFGG